jgi:hypothetical protein
MVKTKSNEPNAKNKVILDPKWKCKKLVRLGVKQKPGFLYYIAKADAAGKFAIFSVDMKRLHMTTNKRVSKIFDLCIDDNYCYYVDSDGDVSRCLRRFFKEIKRLNWIGGC